MDLIDRSSVFVEAPIDEMDAERVKVGQVVRVNVDSRRGQHFKGKLVRVAAYVLDVVEQNRTVEIEAELDDPSAASSLLPGTSADIEVILTRIENVLVIPTGAIGPEGRVLVVKDGLLMEKTITPGLRNWRTTEVKAGLDEGELVVVSRDSPDIQPGALVVIEEEA
jgi:HlyD family secretion protein